MIWNTAFRLRQFALGSLWVLPFVGALLGVLLGSGLLVAGNSVHLPSYWTCSPSTASTLLSAVVGAMAALTGFVITVTVLVVQMATGTFSARYMRLWYRDRMLKMLLALLVGTLAFSLALLRRIQNNFVPDLGVSIAGFLIVGSLLLFLIFLDRFVHRLRPVGRARCGSSFGQECGLRPGAPSPPLAALTPGPRLLRWVSWLRRCGCDPSLSSGTFWCTRPVRDDRSGCCGSLGRRLPQRDLPRPRYGSGVTFFSWDVTAGEVFSGVGRGVCPGPAGLARPCRSSLPPWA